jgi:acetoacetyl-CoA synthetase
MLNVLLCRLIKNYQHKSYGSLLEAFEGTKLMNGEIIWQPDHARITGSRLHAFIKFMRERLNVQLPDYKALHHFSVTNREAFWDGIWDFCGVIGDKGHHVLEYDIMPGAQFFPEARLSYAENLLRKNDDSPCLVFRSEDKINNQLSWRELHDKVSQLQGWMQSHGVGVGTRVAAMMPNSPETIAAMLAATALGATWSSCSPDFGPRGVLDRFGQIEPTVLIACDGYHYAGKDCSVADKLMEIVPQLPNVKATLIVPYLGMADKIASAVPDAISLQDVTIHFEKKPVYFERLPFNHPLFILFSSGTTGIPKCIVHGAGGTLLQHLKEHQLHCDIKTQDKVFYYTTCGWMMWNWLVSALASEATLLLFDGSPFHPTKEVLFDYAEQEQASFFGTSAKYIESCRKEGLKPAQTHDLSALRTITSTGSPLSEEGFVSVYENWKKDVHLASISGGTDIVSCFVLGDPTKPVRAGEIQVAGLGMAIEIWGDDGKAIAHGKGELVCTKAFPSMPIHFWGDPEGEKYKAAYFERFKGIWCHGDFAEWTENGGLIIHGRSDATLNPGGVRIGTAEIYAQVELIPEVLESIAIGQDWQDDVRVLLFVRLRPGTELDDALIQRIKAQIRKGASPRHVPARILSVIDIPRTKSGKIVELAVRDVVHKREVKNKESLANPEALEFFKMDLSL